jgi:hypothetical protein
MARLDLDKLTKRYAEVVSVDAIDLTAGRYASTTRSCRRRARSFLPSGAT